MSDTPPPEDRLEPDAVPPEPAEPRSLARGLGLGLVAFVATFILLFGLANLVRPSGGAPAIASATIRPYPSVAAPSGVASPSAGGSPTTSGPPSPSVPGDPVLVGAGDIADCALDGDAATAALLDSIPGTVFAAGDNAYPHGAATDFSDCYGPTWGRHLGRTFAAAGNHDWETTDLAGYLGYFGAAGAPNGPTWYARDIGTWHVIVLDSDCAKVGGCGPDTVQGRWLTADLAATTARCTLAIWHHPRFSSGEHGNDTGVGPFWDALSAAGADVIINGHDHDYERFAPQNPDGGVDRERGIREFVVGTGGAALREFGTQAANSEFRAAVAHGVIKLVLHPTSYEWTFIPVGGQFSDSGTGPCH
jgi:hypothetical protein